MGAGGHMGRRDLLIDPADLAASIQAGEVVPVDVRDAVSYEAGHIPGAISIPELFDYNALSTDQGDRDMVDTFGDVLGSAGLGGSEHLVVYEDAMNSGLGRSSRGQVILQHLGFSEPLVLNGGLAAWRAVGGAVTTEDQVRQPVVCAVRPAASSPVIGYRKVLGGFDDPGVVRVDVRSRAEWEGRWNAPAGSLPGMRLGRIPRARWIEWTDLLDTSGPVPVHLPPELIKERCQAEGIDADHEIHLYCYKGARASSSYVALRQAGFRHVRLYLGSWREWAADDQLPIEGPGA